MVKLEYEKGYEIAKKAEALLSRNGNSPNSLFSFLIRMENQVWWSRLAWRSNRRVNAGEIIRKAIDELVISYETYMKGQRGGRGGIDLLLAFALNVAASFDWAHGDLAEAQRKVYQSLFLLRNGEAKDPIRFAHSLYMAAKIETARLDNMELAIRMLEQAENYFRRYGHPFARRCISQQAQCLVRAGRREEAVKTLGNLSIDTKTTDREEIAFAEAELTLARVWMLEDAARENMSWEECRDEAQKLIEVEEDLPPRLQTEAHLHYGLALGCSGEGNDGLRHLDLAKDMAARLGRSRIMIAVHFAFVEVLLKLQKNQAEIWTHWNQALQLLSESRSHSLQRWQDFLAPRIAAIKNAPLLIEIDPRQSLSEAEQQLRKTLFLYHREKNGEESISTLGISRATFFRLAGKSGSERRKRR